MTEKCDKKLYSEDSLQKHEANVYDQLDVSGEPVIENRKPSLKIARNVMKSFTVRTLCIYMWSMFILPPIPILSKSVTKCFTVRTVCMDI